MFQWNRLSVSATVLAVAATGLFACSDSDPLAGFPPPTLNQTYAACFDEIAQLPAREGVACFYVEGASAVLESPLDQACTGSTCDLTTWQLRQDGSLQPFASPFIIPFDNADSISTDDIDGVAVWFQSGTCPEPPAFNPFGGGCNGSSTAGSSSTGCFARLSVPLNVTSAGLTVRGAGSSSTFSPSQLFVAEVEQESGDTFGLCAFANQVPEGTVPARQTVEVVIAGSGVGQVTAANVAGFACDKARGETATCAIDDAIVGNTIALVAAPGDETLLAWTSGCDAVDGTTCRFQVPNGAKRIEVDLSLETYPLTINLVNDPMPVLGAVMADVPDSEGNPVTCALAAGEANATCTFEMDSGTAVVLTGNSGDDFALRQMGPWGGDCADPNAVACEVTMTEARTVTATFEFGVYPLTIIAADGQTEPAAGGRITDGSERIDCGTGGDSNRCVRIVDDGEQVMLQADAPAEQAERRVLQWMLEGAAPAAGQCRDLGSTPADNDGRRTGDNMCSFSVGQSPVNLTPVFGFQTQLEVIGDGEVATSPDSELSGCRANQSCEAYLAYNTPVRLTATAVAETGASFVRWTANGEAVDAAAELTVSATAASAYQAVFGHRLTIQVPGGGQCGSVTATGLPTDDALNCTEDCDGLFTYASTINVEATAGGGAAFAGWTGETCGADASCELVMTEGRSIAAAFDYPLNLQIDPPLGEAGAQAGTGGLITGSGISCRDQCNVGVGCDRPALAVSLMAQPDPGYRIGRWTGCSTANDASCSVLMDGAKTVRFAFECFRTLTVNVAGSGQLDGCSDAVCLEEALCNGSATLQARPAGSPATVPVWGGDVCPPEQQSCVVPIDPDVQGQSTSLTFTYPVTVSQPANGQVTGPRGASGQIACGAGSTACQAYHQDRRSVVLEAAPDTGFALASWAGCTQAGGTLDGTQCTLPMTAPANVAAPTFERVYVVTMVLRGAPGRIDVTPTSLGLSTCELTANGSRRCTYEIAENTSVTFTPVGSVGTAFQPWGGNAGCTGTAPCTVVMTQDYSVQASFDYRVSIRPNVTQLPGGLGDLVGARIRTRDPATCAIDFMIGGTPGSPLPSGVRECDVDPDTAITFVVDDPSNGVVNFDGATNIEDGTSYVGNPFTVTVASPTTLDFLFSESFGLTVNISGRGSIRSGSTTCSDLAPSTCIFRVPRSPGTITLTALPNSDGRGWSTAWPAGTCSSQSANTCTVALTADRTISVNFTYPIQFQRDIFSGIISPAGCAGCHAGSGSVAAASGLVIRNQTARQVYNQLVCSVAPNAPACATLTTWVRGCNNLNVGSNRINLANPVNSLFLQMIANNVLPPPVSANSCTNHGFTAFSSSDARYATIRDWVAGGAPFN